MDRKINNRGSTNIGKNYSKLITEMMRFEIEDILNKRGMKGYTVKAEFKDNNIHLNIILGEKVRRGKKLAVKNK